MPSFLTRERRMVAYLICLKVYCLNCQHAYEVWGIKKFGQDTGNGFREEIDKGQCRRCRCTKYKIMKREIVDPNSGISARYNN